MSNVIFWTDISNFPDPATDVKAIKGLPQDKIDKILRLKQVLSRKQSFCSLLMQKYVAEMYGKSLDDIYYGKRGKPLLEGVCFNISHSRNIVVCAVSDTPIGCDVEFIRKAPQSVAKRVFSEQELKTAKWLSPNDSDDRLFFRFWTAKESYTKFIGDGLAFSFKKIYLTLTPYKNQHNIFMVNGKISLILLKEYKIPKHEDFVVFVCTEDRDFNAPLTRLFKKNLI